MNLLAPFFITMDLYLICILLSVSGSLGNDGIVYALFHKLIRFTSPPLPSLALSAPPLSLDRFIIVIISVRMCLDTVRMCLDTVALCRIHLSAFPL